MEAMPGRSISTRGDDGPVWSPDGRMLAFVVESVAWVVDVDPAGRLQGEARQVTSEVTDSPAWLGSDRLLYLNNSRLRSAPITGGEPTTIPVDLRWQRPRVSEKAVIHAGAMWDGTATALRRDVDIVVDGDRIEAVVPHRPERSTVDALGLTVMPGLIDAHIHWHLRGRQWGDRQGRVWLAYGITTTPLAGRPRLPDGRDPRGIGGGAPGRTAVLHHRRGDRLTTTSCAPGRSSRSVPSWNVRSSWATT